MSATEAQLGVAPEFEFEFDLKFDIPVRVRVSSFEFEFQCSSFPVRVSSTLLGSVFGPFSGPFGNPFSVPFGIPERTRKGRSIAVSQFPPYRGGKLKKMQGSVHPDT